MLTFFDPIGFWLPACVAAIYLPRAIRAARAFDWALVFIALITTWLSVDLRPYSVHMNEIYFLCVIFYAYRASFETVGKSMPACVIFVFFFLTLLLPDIYGGATHAVTFPHQTTIVGGAGFTDILLLWPSGASVLYTLFIAAWGAPHRNPGQEAHPWRAFLRYHFSPI